MSRLDRDETHLDVLVNTLGIDQPTASRMLWAAETLTEPAHEPGPRAPLQVQLVWARERARQIVWQGLGPVLKWLGLHTDPMEAYRRAKGESG